MAGSPPRVMDAQGGDIAPVSNRKVSFMEPQPTSSAKIHGSELAQVIARFLTVRNVRGVLTGDFSEYRPSPARAVPVVSPRKEDRVASSPAPKSSTRVASSPAPKVMTRVSPRLAKQTERREASSEDEVELPLRRSARVQRVVPPSQRSKAKKKRRPSPPPKRKNKKRKVAMKAVPKSAH